jgi:hypothetical protein
MAQWLYRLLLLILFIENGANTVPNVTVLAESSAEISCDELLLSMFRSHLGHTLDLAEGLQMIESSLGFTSEQIVVSGSHEAEDNWNVTATRQTGMTRLSWQDGRLSRVSAGLGKHPTTAGQVIDCLGQQPDAYRAIYGPRMEQSGVNYSFEMWFASEGIVARVSSSAESAESIPPISQLTPITDLFLVSPGSLEEMRHRIGAPLMPFTPLIYEEPIADALLPQIWPSDWSQIQYRQAW